jgi:hypothetical protein
MSSPVRAAAKGVTEELLTADSSQLTGEEEGWWD